MANYFLAFLGMSVVYDRCILPGPTAQSYTFNIKMDNDEPQHIISKIFLKTSRAQPGELSLHYLPTLDHRILYL